MYDTKPAKIEPFTIDDFVAFGMEYVVLSLDLKAHTIFSRHFGGFRDAYNNMNITTSFSKEMSSAEVTSDNTFVKQEIADDVGFFLEKN